MTSFQTMCDIWGTQRIYQEASPAPPPPFLNKDSLSQHTQFCDALQPPTPFPAHAPAPAPTPKETGDGGGFDAFITLKIDLQLKDQKT